MLRFNSRKTNVVAVSLIIVLLLGLSITVFYSRSAAVDPVTLATVGGSLATEYTESLIKRNNYSVKLDKLDKSIKKKKAKKKKVEKALEKDRPALEETIRKSKEYIKLIEKRLEAIGPKIPLARARYLAIKGALDYLDSLSDSQKQLQFGPNWPTIRRNMDNSRQSALNTVNNLLLTQQAFKDSIRNNKDAIKTAQDRLDEPGNIAAEIAALQGEMPALEKSIDALNTRLGALETLIYDKFNELKQRINGLEKRINKLEQNQGSNQNNQNGAD